MLKLILIEPMKEFHGAVKDEMEDEFVKFKHCAPGADVALFDVQRQEKERKQQDLRDKMMKSVSKGILKDVNDAKTKKDAPAKAAEEPYDPNAMPEWGEKAKPAPASHDPLKDLATANAKPKVEMGKIPVPELDLNKKDAAPAAAAGAAGSTIATISPGKSEQKQPSIQQTDKTLSPKLNPVVTKESEKEKPKEKEPTKALGAFLKGKFSLGGKKK